MSGALVFGQNLSERVYISTDRDVYVAGDDMFCSAFCFDLGTGSMSAYSSVAYLEISSAEGPVQTARLALQKGRGAGVVSLQNNIPTGNYRLVAYTAQCFNEVGYDFESCSKLISIINPFTTDRASSGVEIVNGDVSPDTTEPRSQGGVRAELGDAVTLTNTSGKTISVSVSLAHDDGIPSPGRTDIASFRSGVRPGTAFAKVRELDYAGEVIRARVRGLENENISKVAGKSAFLSVPGTGSSVYGSVIGEDGVAVFRTENIYGNVDAVLEVDAPELDCHMEIEQPFAGVKATGLAPLKLSDSFEDRILQRSVAMQVLKAAHADSLYDYLPVPVSLMFKDAPVEYVLDDYTRFPLMEELFIEFISQVRAGKDARGRTLNVYLEDTHRPGSSSVLSSLIMLDGVPVPDHNKIFDYDPLLVEKIQVYPNTYSLGSWNFAGIVNFVTYKKNLPSYTFPENARVVSYQGVSFPVASYLPAKVEDVPDLRQTIFWHPMIELAPGESVSLDYVRPSYSGTFRLTVEGVDSEGGAVRAETRSELR